MGFSPSTACSGAYSGVALDWRVFETGVYHAKAAELLLHFLFARLDAGRAARDFSGCWPIGDARQARDFRAQAFRWLDELRRVSVDARDGWWPMDVPVRRSDVDEGRGARFEDTLHVLAALAAHALLTRGGVWVRHLRHAVLADIPAAERTGARLAPDRAEAVGQALQGCRARHARRTRDRQRAQAQWRAAADAVAQQTAAAAARRELVHSEFRVWRRRAGASDVATDASARDVAHLLEAAAAQARRLWAGSAGWVEQHSATVAVADAVVERRANGVRLDARRDVRLAPPPQTADAWARWLAQPARAAPFRGADVSLHAVSQMAAACVAALRRAVGGSPGLPGPSDSAEPARPLPDVAARLQQLDGALEAQDARIARLRRLRAQLLAQREAVVAASVRRPARESRSSALAELAAAVRRPVAGSAGSLPHPPPAPASRAARLAAMWDELAGSDELGMSPPPTRKRALGEDSAARSAKRRALLDDGYGVP
ncbi:hypothetical protein GGI04_002647 [Coemansia thaxteri]|nr:hypothetical protein GGI04_002647 [Coemansia thaxteri]KAJ2471184.1 hypothetical protein GGI02_002440 [Coemansia sp. RSA 2322]